ncbi:YHYH protein, partial [archaeon]|nr:YHYH protein [archaeon]
MSDDKFKLAYAGTNINSVSTSNFDKKLHVNLNSIPQSIGHKFKIPPVTITISEEFSTSTPEITPIIKGNIKNVVIDSNGSEYGSQIVNFIKKPNLTITRGKDAFVKILIRNGRIESAFVINQGNGYDSLPELIINPGKSKGRFGKLLPVISNGKLIDVKVVNSGINYDDTTSVTVLSSGKNAKFDVSIQKWRVNSVHKNVLDSSSNFTENEHYLIPGIKNSLKIVSSYAPKILRSKLGDNENRKQSDINSLTFKHSPIVGWAIDGNPIYSQFGYSIANQSTSEIKRIKSSYLQVPQSALETTLNRPNIIDYPVGYFIEDYYFDESVGDLDENNGRYCHTPEFPGGTYA